MSQAHTTAGTGESLMPATISATLARASEAIAHAAAILDRLEAKAKARAERAEHLTGIRPREDS